MNFLCLDSFKIRALWPWRQKCSRFDFRHDLLVWDVNMNPKIRDKPFNAIKKESKGERCLKISFVQSNLTLWLAINVCFCRLDSFSETDSLRVSWLRNFDALQPS